MKAADYIPYLQQRIRFISDYFGQYQDEVVVKGTCYAIQPTRNYSRWLCRMDRAIAAIVGRAADELPKTIVMNGTSYPIDLTEEQQLGLLLSLLDRKERQQMQQALTQVIPITH